MDLGLRARVVKGQDAFILPDDLDFELAGEHIFAIPVTAGHGGNLSSPSSFAYLTKYLMGKTGDLRLGSMAVMWTGVAVKSRLPGYA